MEKYSANYSYTNHNFTIQNVIGEKQIDNKYYPILCVLRNILHRGCPTIMSQYLQEKLGKLHLSQDFKDILVLIDKDIPIWQKTIKGDDDNNNNYPAKDFYEKYIPTFLNDYEFIQQLILPEVSFAEITGEYNLKFMNQQVDFYLPQAKLVIEIDGQFHQKEDVTRLKDEYRVEYLKKHGVVTVRIDTKDLYNNNSIFGSKIEEIRTRLNQFDKLLNY